MSLAVKVYTAFKDDEEKARALAEIFELLEEKLLDQSQLARSDEFKESHLQLQLEIEKNRTEIEKNRTEIEKVRSDLQIEIEKVRSDLQIEIEKVRSDLQIEIEKVRSDLQIEIEKNRTEIEKTRTAIEVTKTELARLMNRQVIWIIGSVSFVIGMLKTLDYILE